MSDSLGSLPKIEKTIPCLKCAANTTHRLLPYPKGSSWNCTSCNNTVHAFSHSDMINTTMQRVFGLPTAPKPPEIPGGFKVFLEHHGEGAEEKEVSSKDVQQHVNITGELPLLGKPLYTTPLGLKHRKAAIPYGKVVRVISGTLKK